MSLTTDSKERKNAPMARGVLDYFPDALFAVAEVSFEGNEKHNPGQALHWSKWKSTDHADCVLRHLAERGGWIEGEYSKPVRHSAAAAWRALAMLQIEIEADRAGLTVDQYLSRLKEDAQNEPRVIPDFLRKQETPAGSAPREDAQPVQGRHS